MKRSVLILLALVTLVSCTIKIPLGPKPVPVAPKITLEKAVLDTVRSAGRTVTVRFKSNKDWEASTQATWLSLSTTSGEASKDDFVEIQVSVAKYLIEDEDRDAVVSITTILDEDLDTEFEPLTVDVKIIQQKKLPKKPHRGIVDMEDLEDFCRTINNGQSVDEWMRNDTLELHTDLNMAEFSSAWKPIENFKGVFLGNGHHIYNFVYNSTEGFHTGFFDQFEGDTVVKDIVFGSKDGYSYDEVSEIKVAQKAASSSEWIHAGVLVAITTPYDKHYNIQIENITNFIPIQSATKSLLRMGGIVGMLRSAEMKNCYNFANVDYNLDADTSTRNSYIGGVVGIVSDSNNHTGAMYNCSNSGNVTVGGIGAHYIGGVVGGQGTYTATFDKLVNYGKVVCTRNLGKTPSESICIGGVIGYLGEAPLTNSSNFGYVAYDIYKYGSTSTRPHNVGGVIGGTQKKKFTVEDCHNEGEVFVYMFYASGTNPDALNIGGISGLVLGNSASKTGMGSVKGCTNKGYVHANHPGKARIGGISGVVRHTILDDCTNYAALTSEHPDVLDVWCSVGGITGYLDWNSSSEYDGAELVNCHNAASASVNSVLQSTSSYSLTSPEDVGGVIAGGIVGIMAAGKISGCENEAPVLALNNLNDENASVYAGGVAGLVIDWAQEVKSNKNTGSVTAKTFGAKKENSLAGGVVAINAKDASNITENVNSGSLEARFGEEYSQEGTTADQIARQINNGK